MKYSDGNKPLVCMMTRSSCYRGTEKFTPKGILWHSTGCNNPELRRYVQPDDNASDRDALIKKLGKNTRKNDWNHMSVQAGLNAWIGKLADGSVTTVQTMPWNFRPWGCGGGKKGSCNDTHIQFEICEDSLTNKAYFNTCYKEAVEFTAYLCRKYGIDPKGTVKIGGVNCPTIIDHVGANRLGLATAHADIQHWMKRYGKTMENVRNDVAILLEAEGAEVDEDSVVTAPSESGGTSEVVVMDEEAYIWNELLKACGNKYGAAGMMGNLKAESNCHANNLQNNGNRKLGLTDEEFTAKVDGGKYSKDKFIHDGYGYGLAQWTYWTRKAKLWNAWKEAGGSIGSVVFQTAFLIDELKNYKEVWDAMCTGTSVKAVSNAVLTKYERPADQSDSVKKRRASFGQEFYDKYAGDKKTSAQDVSTVLPIPTGGVPYRIRTFSKIIIRKAPGTDSGRTGRATGIGVYTIVKEADGKGAQVWGKLKSGAGWIPLDGCERLN